MISRMIVALTASHAVFHDKSIAKKDTLDTQRIREILERECICNFKGQETAFGLLFSTTALRHDCIHAAIFEFAHLLYHVLSLQDEAVKH